MKAAPTPLPPEVLRFRRRLFGAMLGVVALFTGIVLVVARDRIAADVEQSFEREFAGAVATLHRVSQLRHAALLERSRALARRSRIHAAIEDDALDLLYPSARDELRDAIHPPGAPAHSAPEYTLRARFYRFLDANGNVIGPPPDDETAGSLPPAAEKRLTLPRLSPHPQTGYIPLDEDTGAMCETIATPIISLESGEPIAALVLGFEPLTPAQAVDSLPGFTSGIWLGDEPALPALNAGDESLLAGDLRDHVRTGEGTRVTEGRFRFRSTAAGGPHLVFFKELNPGSLFPPAYEVSLFPLATMQARQRRATWQVLGVGAVVLLGGFAASHHLARRFARPVAVLAYDSREQRAQRQRVEAELETTSAELERVARFSADASHQLKTPVTVLRAGLDEILARGAVPPAEVEEISALIHQTYRLSTIIDDLLLLSRLDAGQLRIQAGELNLAHLIVAGLDDLSASPDDFALEIESDFPPELLIAGEKRYVALILQNLLENARKYNRPGGRIRITARVQEGETAMIVGNTTRRPIPPESQPHIFERFHRGAVGENVPGYGIGLNLARELTRLHGGELRLLRSDADWTEFEATFRTRRPATSAVPS